MFSFFSWTFMTRSEIIFFSFDRNILFLLLWLALGKKKKNKKKTIPSERASQPIQLFFHFFLIIWRENPQSVSNNLKHTHFNAHNRLVIIEMKRREESQFKLKMNHFLSISWKLEFNTREGYGFYGHSFQNNSTQIPHWKKNMK